MRKMLLVVAALLFISISSYAENKTAENLINVSWGDNIMVNTGVSQMDTPEKIAKCLKAWSEGYDAKYILWRISAEYIDEFYEKRSTSDFAKSYNKKVAEIKALFNPYEVVGKNTAKYGQEFLLYATFNDHGAPTSELYAGDAPFPWQDRTTIEHPEYQERDLEGNWHYGVLDLSNPNARKFIIKRLASYVEKFNADGLYACCRTHSVPAKHADQFGFGPVIVSEYQKRYGIDITKDPRFNYRSNKFAPDSKEVENWRRLRGEYMVEFYRELRKATSGKTLLIALPRGHYMGAPFGNLYVDYETIIEEKLADGLVISVFPGRGLYPKRTESHASLGYKTSEDDKLNLPSRSESTKTYGKLCRKSGMKLFYNTGSLNPTISKWIDGEANLYGVMMNAPLVRPLVFIGDTPALRSAKPLTIEGYFWIAKSQGGVTSPRLISKYGHLDNAQRGWEIMLGDKGQLQFRCNLVNKDGKQTDIYLASPDALPREKWVHVAAVFDPAASQNRIYVDGKLSGEKSIPNGSRLNDNSIIDVVLGCYGGYGVMEFSGKIDEVRLTGKALKFEKAPSRPYTGQEDETMVLLHLDDAGSMNINSGKLKTGIRLVGAMDTSKSLPGFGSALNLLD